MGAGNGYQETANRKRETGCKLIINLEISKCKKELT